MGADDSNSQLMRLLMLLVGIPKALRSCLSIYGFLDNRADVLIKLYLVISHVTFTHVQYEVRILLEGQ